ncbi:unnamed protein product [Caenorhabditis brenneri]
MSGFFDKIAGFIGATSGEIEVPEATDVLSSDDSNSDSSFDMVSLNSSSEESDFESVKEEDSNDSSVDFGTMSGGRSESDINRSDYSFAEDSDHSSEYSHISSDDSDSEEPEFAMKVAEDILFRETPRMESSASFHSHLHQQYGPNALDSEDSFDDGADIREETDSESDVSTEEIEKIVVNIMEEKMGTAMASVFSKMQVATKQLSSIETKVVENNTETHDESFCEAYSAALVNPMEVMEVEEVVVKAEKIQDPKADREYTGLELIRMFDEELDPEAQFWAEQFLDELQKACSGEEDPTKRRMKIRQFINKNMSDYVKDLQQRINKLAGRKRRKMDQWATRRMSQPPLFALDANSSEHTLRAYFKTKVEQTEQLVAAKQVNVCRLQAQKNGLNGKVRMLKEEINMLHEQASHVGEVVKAMDAKKVLVKNHPDGKYIVDVDKSIDISKLTAGSRVALRADSYTLHKILPNRVDPLVSLMMVEKVPDSTYEMVGGLDKQIKEIKEVIELPVKHPELFDALGIAQPKGVLLYGPPGTGKTLLARAVAHHTECTFIRVSGSELVQKFIGEGARMVRELFVMAREHSPSIIFMDEIDSIGSARLDGNRGGDSEVQRTMLELLNQLDGFESTKNIKVIMATNRIDILDSALLRPGRIDRKIEFPAPDEKARAQILKIHSRKMNLMRGIRMDKIAEQIPGASGAEVKSVCTEAGMFALRERRIHVTQEDFEMAVGKVMQKDSDKNMSIKQLFK